MGISPASLFKLLLYSLFWGIVTGLINDGFRMSRILLFNPISQDAAEKYNLKNILPKKYFFKESVKVMDRIKTAITVLEDIFLSWLYVFGLIFLNYAINNGEFRFFSVAVSLVAWALYYFTIGKIVCDFSEKLCSLVKISFLVILKTILCPFVYISTKIAKKIKNFFAFFQKAIAKSYKKRYNKYKEKSLLEYSISGFTVKKHECKKERSLSAEKQIFF